MRLPVLILILALATPALAGEVVTRIDLDTGIGETRLANGLTVLTLERHNAPVVSCQIWYRVGSADELPGETGLAHFLEHMLFKGTDRFEKGEIDRITLELGGSNNAGTYKDWTYYYFNFAADRWERALEIEANRMRRVTFDPEEFAAERNVVLEELRNGRDGPWGELDETLEASAFLAHPYRHPVIGWQRDVESIPRKRVKAFYDLHYHPRNATLVIVGDFDTRRALTRVMELFGDLPAGPERGLRRSTEPRQNGERRVVVHRAAELARLEVIYHSIPVADPDDATADVIVKLLTRGKASRLERRLVHEEGLCTFVSAMNDSRRDAGLFWIYAELVAGADPKRVEEIIHEETGRLASEALGEEELARAKTALETNIVFGQAKAEGLAEGIGHLASVADWRQFGTQTDRIRAVTAGDVARLAGSLFRPGNRTVGLALPGGEGGGSKGAPPRRRAARRSGRVPAAGGSVAVRLEPEVVTLENGLQLILTRDSTLPVLALRGEFEGSRLHEQVPGVAHLTSTYLLAGAGERDGFALAEELDRIGASLETDARGFAGRCLSQNAAALTGLLADVLRRPAFPEDEFETLRNRVLSELRSEEDDPDATARLALYRQVYGDHPLGRRARGTPESVAAISREDVLEHHRTFHEPARTVIAVVSDLPAETVRALFEEALGDWKAASARMLPPLPEPPPMAPAKIRIERNLDQATILLGHLGVRRSDPDYFPLLVMDYVLGMSPGFTDRLSRTLRDRDGLAYSVYATISGSAGVEPGIFVAYLATAADQAKRAIAGMRREIGRMLEEEVTPEEIAGAKAYLTGSFVFGYETAEQVAERLVTIHRFKIGFDHPAKFAKLVQAVTREDILRVARKHLRPEMLVEIVVGPASGD